MSRHKREITESLLEQALTDVATRFDQDGGVLEFTNKVLTKKERIIIGRRILIARLFLEGYTGAEISELMQTSPNTLSRIRCWLEDVVSYSSIPTPRSTAAKFRSQPKPSVRYGAPFSFERLRKNYPAHFLLFNLVAELRKPKDDT